MRQEVTDRVLLRYQLPLSELAGDFYSKLKSATQGSAMKLEAAQ
jgi:translation elongation factor EF-4